MPLFDSDNPAVFFTPVFAYLATIGALLFVVYVLLTGVLP